MPSTTARLFASIYTDEHVTPDLARALRQRGYIAQSANMAGMRGRSDWEQLVYAAEHGMALLTFDVADFAALAAVWYAESQEHAGIILSEQLGRRQFGELLRRMLRLLDSLTAEELRNSVVYLQQFR